MIWCQNLAGLIPYGQPCSQSQHHKLTRREVEMGMPESVADSRNGGPSDSVADSKGEGCQIQGPTLKKGAI